VWCWVLKVETQLFGAFGSSRAWEMHDDGEFAQRVACGVTVSGGVAATEGANDSAETFGADVAIAQDRDRVPEFIPRAGVLPGLSV
jgi:hypothetical protein